MSSLPSVWVAVTRLVGFLALWVIASIPVYAFLTVWLQLREIVSASLRSLAEWVRTRRARRSEHAALERQELVDHMTAFQIDQTAAAAWHQTLATMLDGVRAGGVQIDKTRTTAIGSIKRLEPIARRLRKLKLVSALVPEVPPIDEALLRVRQNRTAAINLFVALLLLVPISFANAQLTGLVLRELLPPVQPILGIPVAYALAFIIVIAEAAVGLLHSAEAERREESERRLTVESIVWNFAALGVVGIEALLYSQVQPESGTLRLPIGGSAFALVGFILGLAVFGLGRLAHGSAIRLRKDQTPKVIAKQLRALRDAADQWNLVAERLQPVQKACSDQFEHLIDFCHRTSQAQADAIQQFTIQVDGLRESPPPWARPKERPLTLSELTEREARVYLWTAITAIAALSLVVISVWLPSHLGAFARAATGLGLTVAAFGAGALGSQSAPAGRGWRLAWYVVLVGLVGGFTIIAARLLWGVVNLRTAIALFPALAAFTAGIQVGQSVALLRLPLLWVGERLVTATLFFCVAAFWLVNAAMAIVEYLARLIAWPTITVIRTVRSKRDTRSHATIA